MFRSVPKTAAWSFETKKEEKVTRVNGKLGRCIKAGIFLVAENRSIEIAVWSRFHGDLADCCPIIPTIGPDDGFEARQMLARNRSRYFIYTHPQRVRTREFGVITKYRLG